MKYKYGARGNGMLFFKRLLCHHDFKALDVYGKTQCCRKCGLYRSRLRSRGCKKK